MLLRPDPVFVRPRPALLARAETHRCRAARCRLHPAATAASIPSAVLGPNRVVLANGGALVLPTRDCALADMSECRQNLTFTFPGAVASSDQTCKKRHRLPNPEEPANGAQPCKHLD